MRNHCIWVKHKNKKRCSEIIGRIVSPYPFHFTLSPNLNNVVQREIPYEWGKESEVNTQPHYGPQHQAHPTEPWSQSSPKALDSKLAPAVPGSRPPPRLKWSPWLQISTDGPSFQANPVTPGSSGLRVQAYPNGPCGFTAPHRPKLKAYPSTRSALMNPGTRTTHPQALVPGQCAWGLQQKAYWWIPPKDMSRISEQADQWRTFSAKASL